MGFIKAISGKRQNKFPNAFRHSFRQAILDQTLDNFAFLFIQQMLDFFKNSPNVVYAYETISDNDIEFELEVKSHEDFQRNLDEIKKRFGKSIRRDHYFIWGKEHKFLFMP